MNKQYDYLILGGGASGLSLAYRMIHDSFFDKKKIGIIEPDSKDSNDRTWCYWSKESSMFSDVVSKQWDQLVFNSDSFYKDIDKGDYSYQMIRGKDLYDKVIPEITKSENIEWISERVVSIEEEYSHVVIDTQEHTYQAEIIFKSYIDFNINKIKNIYVDQHFKGFWITTESDQFNENQATFMDFVIDQNNETRFMYVLPKNKRQALVELAIFSNDLLEQDDYDKVVSDYIKHNLKIDNYKIDEKEYGVIPMTSYPFYEHDTDRIVGIGTMAGCVKSSSGFAFERIQRHSDQLIGLLKNGGFLPDAGKFLRSRYAYYDKIFLDAILNGNTTGKEVFTALFKKQSGHDIFRFLDQKSTFYQDLKLFKAPPFLPFIRSFFKTFLLT